MEPILARHMQRLNEIEQDGRTAIVGELRTLNEELAAVLSEDQMQQWEQLLQVLPGQIRHAPGFGPGLGPGAGGGRGMGRGRFGPGRGGQGPLRVSPNTPPVSEPNDATPGGQPVPHQGPVHVN